MNQKIEAEGYDIEIGSLASSSFSEFLRGYSNSKKVILVDENTHDHCLEYLLTAFSGLEDAEVMLLPSGEENKVMEVCFQVWEAWSEYQIGRNDLVINLGGGVVTDMGGFIASIFKRGLNFIQIPTSLLAMVDASVGGKTGIDLGRHKNQLGVFANPEKVYIDPGFLKTLPAEELKNGYSEMLKHGLIADKLHWENLKKINFENSENLLALILCSIAIKNKIVLSDPLEKADRKKLNFGHTFGHALEGFFLGREEPLAHGHAVAIGILAESFISWQRSLLSETDFKEISSVILTNFEIPFIELDWIETIFSLMLNDKKNFNQKVQCVLLNSIGECIVDQVVEKEDLVLVLNFISNLKC
jgi:3-dehydroquinate synthase